MWIMVPWASWTRGVWSAGTMMARSHFCARAPPVPPVRPTVSAPRALASSMATLTFCEFPLVERPMTASPSRTKAATCLRKTSSIPKSLPMAVRMLESVLRA